MIFRITIVMLVILSLSFPAFAKKDKTNKKSQEAQKALSKEDQRLFDSLSKEQKDKITKGQIDRGFNAWMVKMALGEPLYGTEHHPIFTDYEEVWLYAKPEVTKKVEEEKIIDPQTNWPTIHRKITTKTCQISDFFVLWDRGVVADIKKSKDRNINGSCTLEKQEAYLPIVDGKPVEPK